MSLTGVDVLIVVLGVIVGPLLGVVFSGVVVGCFFGVVDLVGVGVLLEVDSLFVEVDLLGGKRRKIIVFGPLTLLIPYTLVSRPNRV